MRQQAGFVLLLMLFMSSPCLAYEVVLKNGKVLRGEVVSDNQEILILQDASGVELQIRHSQIDVSKTQEHNQKVDIAAPQKEETVPPARQEAMPEKSKKKSRVYTKEDLEKMPELSIVGTNESAEEVEARNRLKDQPTAEQEAEAAWNEEALRVDDEIQSAREAYEYNKSLCDRVIPDVTDLRDGAYVKLSAEQYEEQRRFACVQADAAAKDLKKAEAKFEQLLEEARKAGIPPGWVDPARIHR